MVGAVPWFIRWGAVLREKTFIEIILRGLDAGIFSRSKYALLGNGGDFERGGCFMATVGQLMTREVSVISESESLQAAAQQMQVQRIGSLLVEKAGEYSGIITETDVVRAVAEQRDVTQLNVQRLMSSPIISIDTKFSPQYARDVMADRRIRHLAITEEGKIVGIISVRDLLAYFKTVSKVIE